MPRNTALGTPALVAVESTPHRESDLVSTLSSMALPRTPNPFPSPCMAGGPSLFHVRFESWLGGWTFLWTVASRLWPKMS